HLTRALKRRLSIHIIEPFPTWMTTEHQGCSSRVAVEGAKKGPQIREQRPVLVKTTLYMDGAAAITEPRLAGA
ncbi:hypothetical protein, partial [Altericroceibacterium xinjiangense]|uniref:hypothetical protein n=1 Tax=Altericroceibacterium xinjiangense TaxID=762261 RepID=UPI0019D26C65